MNVQSSINLPTHARMLVRHLAIAHGVHQTLWRLLLQWYGTARLGTCLARAAGLIVQLYWLRVELHFVLLEQKLQLHRYLVPQIEQTIAGMMRVQAQLGTVWRYGALGAHHKGSSAAVAELELTLSAGEVHAAAPESERFYESRIYSL